MDVLDIVEFLKSRVELFRDFPDDRLRELAEGSKVATFEPNEAAIVFGEEGRFLGVVISPTCPPKLDANIIFVFLSSHLAPNGLSYADDGGGKDC